MAFKITVKSIELKDSEDQRAYGNTREEVIYEQIVDELKLKDVINAVNQQKVNPY